MYEAGGHQQPLKIFLDADTFQLILTRLSLERFRSWKTPSQTLARRQKLHQFAASCCSVINQFIAGLQKMQPHISTMRILFLPGCEEVLLLTDQAVHLRHRNLPNSIVTLHWSERQKASWSIQRSCITRGFHLTTGALNLRYFLYGAFEF